MASLWERALGLGSRVRVPGARAHHGGPLTARGKPRVLPRHALPGELESVKCAVHNRRALWREEKGKSGSESRPRERGAHAPHDRPPAPHAGRPATLVAMEPV